MNTVILGWVSKSEADYAICRLMLIHQWDTSPYFFLEVETAEHEHDFDRCSWSGPKFFQYIRELRGRL